MASSFEIGLSGLEAARRALDTIGNNVANAATEGYHKQRLDLSPASPSFLGGVAYGTGVTIDGTRRILNGLLESEINTQSSASQAVSQELSGLRIAESILGELGGGKALNDYLNRFFEALRDLSLHPNELTWQNQFVAAADVMASQFRSVGESLSDLATRTLDEAQDLAEQVNVLADEIATLNASIEKVGISGMATNNLGDQRDQKIAQLAELVDVSVQKRDYGVVDVVAAGIPVVIGQRTTNLEVTLVNSTTMGLGTEGTGNPITSGVEGQIGGLLDFKNSLLPALNSELDALAKAITDQVNAYHVQGLGTAGSFTSLTGRSLGSATTNLSDLDSDITAGTLYIRLTNTSTGTVTRHAVTIGAPSSTTLGDVATAISAINGGTGLSATVTNNKLVLSADANYTFDFIPAPLPTPSSTSFSGTTDPTVTVSGHYGGTSNKTFTATVTGSGEVGNDASLTLTVNDGSADIASFNIGAGYVVGDPLDLDNGLVLTLSTGDLVNGDTFTVPAFSDTDSAGILAATGINTFFEGDTAQSLKVLSRFKDNPARVATALGADLADNHNAARMADLVDTAVATLSNRTIHDYYQTSLANLGDDITIAKSRHDNIESVLQNLNNRLTEVSGVDINEEAASILMYEQMFQAMAKFMNTVNSTMQILMDSM